jgi:hypothetical protein
MKYAETFNKANVKEVLDANAFMKVNQLPKGLFARLKAMVIERFAKTINEDPAETDLNAHAFMKAKLLLESLHVKFAETTNEETAEMDLNALADTKATPVPPSDRMMNKSHKDHAAISERALARMDLTAHTVINNLLHD